MSPNLEEIVDFFSEYLKISFVKIPHNFALNIEEIRLRVFKPVILNFSDKSTFLNKNGNLVDINRTASYNLLVSSKNDIEFSFKKMCNYSIYSYQHEINSGYITIKGGHRVGICGTAIYNKNSIKNIKDISSMNIRVNQKNNAIDPKILDIIHSNFFGLLVVGKPSSGKTTVLRNIAKELSNITDDLGKMNKIVLIDERNEFSGTYMGIPQNDVGYSDLLVNYNKKDAICGAIRALSPNVIICDEISTLEDTQAIKIGAHSGVRFVASAHSSSIEEVLNKIYIKELIDNNIFDKIILLDSCLPGKIFKIFNVPNSRS